MLIYRVSKSRLGDWYIVQKRVDEHFTPVYHGCSVLAFKCQADAENAVRELICGQFQKAS